MKRPAFGVRASLILSIAGLFVPAVGYSASTRDGLLDLLPADTLICLRLNHFSGTLEKMDQYLAGVSPMPVSMGFTMFLGGVLGDPMLNGVNKSGTLAAVVLPKGPDEDPEMVILLPTTDPKTYISSPYCQGADENGIYTLSAPGSSAGPVAFLPLEGTAYLMLRPAGGKESLLFARSVFKEKKQSLAARLSAADAQNASSAPAWFWVNAEKGYALFAPDFLKSEIRAGLAAATQNRAMPLKTEAISAMVNALDAWLAQMDSFSVLLSPVPEQLTAEMLFTAKANSDLAKMLVRDPAMKQGFSMGGYLDAEAPINGLMVVNKPLMEKINQSFLEVFTAFAGEKGATLRSRFETVKAKSLKAIGQEAAFSFGYTAGTPPFAMREVFEITDAAAMREAIRDGWDLVNEFYGIFGIPVVCTVQEKAAQYKGVSIDRAVLRFAPSESASEQEKKMLETMYGKDGLMYPFAVTHQGVFIAVGPQSEEAIQKMIDLPANAPVPAEMQAALQTVPNAQTADAVFSVNVLRLIQGFVGMMRSMQALNPDAPMPPFFEMMESIPVQSQSAMAVGVRADGGRVQMHAILPKQHLMEIMAWSMQLQQRMMMQQFQQHPNQPAAQPAEPEESGGGPL